MAFSRGSRFEEMSNTTHCENYPTQLENISKKERFGLFSQPPGLSIGDKYGRPKTQQEPRGVLTNKKLSSQVEPSLFQFPNFTSINDPYKESFKSKQIVDQQRVSNIPHNQAFKPTDTVKTLIGSQYEHMKEFEDKRFNTRNQDGSVRTQPKNFYTQPHKKGFGNTTTGHLFGPVAYESDPYERPKDFDVQDRATHKSKILNLEKPFINTQQRNHLFEDNIDTYGNYRPQQESRQRSYDYKGVSHGNGWKPGNPAKQGYNKTISKFPDYHEEGDAKRFKKKVPFVNHNKTWKPNSNGTFAKPCPAISNLVTNYKQMSSFRR